MAANNDSDKPNPYESPRTESDPPPRQDVDPIYRLQRFLLVVVPAIIGAVLGYLIMAFFAPVIPSKEVGAGIGGFIGMFVGVAIRIATRRR